jgi:hypothetical protein
VNTESDLFAAVLRMWLIIADDDQVYNGNVRQLTDALARGAHLAMANHEFFEYEGDARQYRERCLKNASLYPNTGLIALNVSNASLDYLASALRWAENPKHRACLRWADQDAGAAVMQAYSDKWVIKVFPGFMNLDMRSAALGKLVVDHYAGRRNKKLMERRVRKQYPKLKKFLV